MRRPALRASEKRRQPAAPLPASLAGPRARFRTFPGGHTIFES